MAKPVNYGLVELGGKSMSRTEARQRRVQQIEAELNPRGNAEFRAKREKALSDQRKRQIDSAWVFLLEGEAVGNGTKPPYGDVWDRGYNVRPYPEAVPSDFAAEHLYEGTEIGHLYGIVPFDAAGVPDSHHAWKLAGWNLVRTGSETRSKRR